MQLQLVTLEQAKKLKELGFDWECIYLYDESGKRCSVITKENHNDLPIFFSAPEIALALKWFRDERGMRYNIEFHNDLEFRNEEHYEYNYWEDTYNNCKCKWCKTYEAAESALLDALIEYAEGNSKCE